ncbi:hypothetical protein SeMB42_g07435 [Synchytrium endobioticum]|uniref:Uncharacterized protein n=1 Tax=Synchytrium endobioticum TaxID=286115 RepID=A0A507BYB8_9FUNG|nr:hypothetical protein SeMB42_g07435 [Synchytrium endobioticum]
MNMARKERECRYVNCENRKGHDQRNCPSKKADGEAEGQKASTVSPVVKRKSVKSADVKDSAAKRPCAAQTWDPDVSNHVAAAALSIDVLTSNSAPEICNTAKRILVYPKTSFIINNTNTFESKFHN